MVGLFVLLSNGIVIQEAAQNKIDKSGIGI
jgi:hypothetical protein